jgi:hypothetical protein
MAVEEEAMLESALKTQIMNQVDRQFDDQTKVLADLVKIPSTRFREAPQRGCSGRTARPGVLPERARPVS